MEVFEHHYYLIDDEILVLEHSELSELIPPNDTSGVTESGDAWLYWFCLPGCLPESDPLGPFKTEKEALENVLEVFGD